mgnify:CR=1 FL=1
MPLLTAIITSSSFRFTLPSSWLMRLLSIFWLFGERILAKLGLAHWNTIFLKIVEIPAGDRNFEQISNRSKAAEGLRVSTNKTWSTSILINSSSARPPASVFRAYTFFSLIAANTKLYPLLNCSRLEAAILSTALFWRISSVSLNTIKMLSASSWLAAWFSCGSPSTSLECTFPISIFVRKLARALGKRSSHWTSSVQLLSYSPASPWTRVPR